MSKVCVTGIGLVSALGHTVRTWEALLAGTTAIALGQPFRELGVYPLARLGKYPAELEPLVLEATAQAVANNQGDVATNNSESMLVLENGDPDAAYEAMHVHRLRGGREITRILETYGLPPL